MKSTTWTSSLTVRRNRQADLDDNVSRSNPAPLPGLNAVHGQYTDPTSLVPLGERLPRPRESPTTRSDDLVTVSPM